MVMFVIKFWVGQRSQSVVDEMTDEATDVLFLCSEECRKTVYPNNYEAVIINITLQVVAATTSFYNRMRQLSLQEWQRIEITS